MRRASGLYPECYLLAKGYREFYANCSELCEPRGYVSMFDKRFQHKCQDHLKIKRRRELRRSNTFSGYSREMFSDDTENDSGPSSARSTVEIDLQDDDAFRTHQNLLRSSSNNLTLPNPKRPGKSRSTDNLTALVDNAIPFPFELADNIDLPENTSLITSGSFFAAVEDSVLARTEYSSFSDSQITSTTSCPSLESVSASTNSSAPTRSQSQSASSRVQISYSRQFRTSLPEHSLAQQARKNSASRPSSLDKDGKVVKRSFTELQFNFNHQ